MPCARFPHIASAANSSTKRQTATSVVLPPATSHPFPPEQLNNHQPPRLSCLAAACGTLAVTMAITWTSVGVGQAPPTAAVPVTPPLTGELPATAQATPVAAPQAAQPAPTNQPAAPLPAPQRRAHSHNDYEHDGPLTDALAHGFTSVEADIYLVDDQLLVAHDRIDLNRQRTLAGLYLEPLRARAEAHDGQIWPGTAGEFILWIDIKSDASTTFARLQQELLPYAELLTRQVAGKTVPGPLLIVISGNRDAEAIAKSNPRLCTVDGRLPDLENPPYGPEVMRFVSDNWTTHFRWRGEGPMPAAERQKLHDLVRRAHSQERRIRFWATPEAESVWQELLAAQVDLLNTDQLAKLQGFLQTHDR